MINNLMKPRELDTIRGLLHLRSTIFSGLWVVSVACLLALEPASAQWSPELTKVIEGAKKEGQLKLLWGEGSFGGSEGAKRYQALLSKMFGTNITIRFTPGPSMPAMGSQLATEYAAGQPAATDIYIGAGSYRGPLIRRGIFHAVDWPKLLPKRITPEMVEGGNTSLRIYSGLPGVPHNTRLVPSPELPKTLKDFLRPEWKGKIASTPYATSLEILAADEMLGRENALDYVRSLSRQIAGLIRCNETERVVSGEFLALVMDCNGADTFALKEKGAPVDLLVPTDGAQIRYFYLSIPKNAEHPNAAKLFTVLAMTGEGQKLMWEVAKADLHLFPESNIGRKIRPLEKQEVKFFAPTIEWLLRHPEIEQTREEMAKILSRGR